MSMNRANIGIPILQALQGKLIELIAA